MTDGRWRQRWRRTERVRRRLLLSAALGSIAALALGVLDALWARGDPGAPSALAVAWLDAGLLCPLSLLLGLAVGLASWLIHPVEAPTVPGLLARLRAAGAGRPADVAAFVPLVVLASFAWLVVCAQLARRLLDLELPARQAGVLLAVCALGIAVVLALVVLVLTPWLRHRLATWRLGYGRWVDPAFTLGVALALCALLVGYGLARGGVSGEGGVLGIFGVLKRQELDLRLPGAVALLAVGVYLGVARLAGVRSAWAWLALVAPLALTARSALVLNAQQDVAAHIERHAPLGRPALAVLRRLTDRDGDGASRWFAGGDCNDADPAIGPGAVEIAGNGIDEDCSGADLPLAALAAAAPSAAPAAADASERVPKDGNLLFLVVDTLRADGAGFMGYPRPTTPNLDKLAARSVIFERAYSLASYTGKSVGPMLIGKYGSETHRNWGHFNKFGEQDIFVAQRLQRAGIRTLSVQGHRYFGPFGGIDRGFDVVDLSAAPPEGTKWAIDTDITSDKLTDAAIALLDQPVNSGRRFFLYIQYLDPHADYKRHPDGPDFGSKARDLYDGEVAFTDRHLGRLLDYVRQQPWAKRTSIIVTADHGEAFGDNGMWRHGFELWEALVHVPLVIYVPGIEPHRVTARRSHIDLVPTMLDLMRVDPPPPTSAPDATDFLSGVSLLPDLFPAPGSKPAVRDILIDMPGGPYNEARRAFIHGDWKLILSRGAHRELFDLSTDPGESKNVWGTRGKEIADAYAAAKARLREIEVTGKAGE